jgi:putative IMPACT (imprinted ancient) family translation regulator
MRLSKEVKNKIKQETEKILWEEKKKQELLNINIDYNFLQSLINKTNENPDLVITIYFKSGDKMILQSQFKEDRTIDYYNGSPSINEMEVK